MNEKQLDQIQNELLNQIDSEAETDKNIRVAAEEIAAALALSHETRYSFNDIPYSFRYILDRSRNKVIIIAANEIKFQIAGPGKYKPFIIESNLEADYTEQECIIAAIEGFIRHVTGNIKPEILDDDNNSGV